MPKVKMLAEISGTRDGVQWPVRGEVIDVSEAEAADMIHARLAEAVNAPAPAKAERAVAKKPETATKN